eukprot:364439-Chlamydomonas_euryale.AAC.5
MHARVRACVQVERIEAEKLKAVGLRNRVAALEEVREDVSGVYGIGVSSDQEAFVQTLACRSASGGRLTRSASWRKSKKSLSGAWGVWWRRWHGGGAVWRRSCCVLLPPWAA